MVVSTYELGRPSFDVASAAAELAAAGADVEILDLSVGADLDRVAGARFVAFHVPMHTATRLAVSAARRVRELAPGATRCFFGLYAPLNAELLGRFGEVVGAEFEGDLVAAYRRTVGDHPPRPGRRRRFRVPDRSGFPPLERYARLRLPSGELRVAGATTTTRGCRHRCRHCPIVPVYRGRFVAVPAEVVIADVRQQIAAGAEHLTFADPDFLNGPTHALRIVRRLHAAFPDLTYDVTIKVAHLLRHRRLLPTLRDTGCVLVTTAVESFDDRVLARLAKGHTAADAERALEVLAEVGIAANPTFVPFTPWTTLEGYLGLLDRISELGLVGAVAPVQYAIRLLLPAGSRLLDLPEVAAVAGDFDPDALAHPWRHPDPDVDALWREIDAVVRREVGRDADRAAVFGEVRRRALHAAGRPAPRALEAVPDPVTVPYLTEPWYC
ncbi:MAG TPA: radical SAM protein [Actinobacteria bacterium]|nr:radical SAM protein [Actinomycetota bacterium]